MRVKSLALALAVLLAPAVASATTVTTDGNQTSINYTNTNSDVSLGNFNLMDEPVGVSAQFWAPFGTDVSGSLEFGVFADPFAAGAAGSLDVNIATGGATYSGTFDGTPLVFTSVLGDFVAAFSTTFSAASDVALFTFDFSGFKRGDLFQVNVAAVPIPLPATLPLLLGALLGLGFLSRRRKAAAA